MLSSAFIVIGSIATGLAIGLAIIMAILRRPGQSSSPELVRLTLFLGLVGIICVSVGRLLSNGGGV